MSAYEPPSHDHSSDSHLRDGHLSNDALIDALYGLSGPGVEEHTRACTACAARRNDLERKRGAMAAPVNATPTAMAELRKNVYRRIEHPSLAERVLGNATSQWSAPALAGVAACALAVGLLVHNPLRPAYSTPPAVSSAEQSAPSVLPAVAGDTQLYTDVYAMEQSFEPSASASLGVLFEQPESAANAAAERVIEQQ